MLQRGHLGRSSASSWHSIGILHLTLVYQGDSVPCLLDSQPAHHVALFPTLLCPNAPGESTGFLTALRSVYGQYHNTTPTLSIPQAPTGNPFTIVFGGPSGTTSVYIADGSLRDCPAGCEYHNLPASFPMEPGLDYYVEMQPSLTDTNRVALISIRQVRPVFRRIRPL